jgi:hypothetical protein
MRYQAGGTARSNPLLSANQSTSEEAQHIMLCKWEGERADDQHFKYLRPTSETRVQDSSQNAGLLRS